MNPKEYNPARKRHQLNSRVGAKSLYSEVTAPISTRPNTNQQVFPQPRHPLTEVQNQLKPTAPPHQTTKPHEFLTASISYLQLQSSYFVKVPLPPQKVPLPLQSRNVKRTNGNAKSTRSGTKLKGRELPRKAVCLTRRGQPQAPRFISRIACTGEKSHRTFATRFNRKRLDLKIEAKRF